MEDSQINQNPHSGAPPPPPDNASTKTVSCRRDTQSNENQKRLSPERRRENKKRSRAAPTKRQLHITAVDQENDGDEKEELERKILALQRIVPGGEAMEGSVDKLFEETAGYILALQCRIKAMKVLANFIQGLDTKEKAKFGA